MSNLLQWAATERRQGILVICRRRMEKWLSFRDGSLLGCVSDAPADFFGPALLGTGRLDERQLLRALTWAEEHQERLGVALLETGAMTEDEIREALAEHVRDQVCDLFLWRHGVFYFEERSIPEEALPPRPLDPQVLALEGSRWADEAARMRRVLVSDEMEVTPATVGAEDLGNSLTPLQDRVLHHLPAAGATLEQLHRTVQGPRFRFLEALFDLAVQGLVEPNPEIPERADESQELALSELLLERATERRQALHRTRLSLPFDVVADLYGVLIDPDPALEEAGLAPQLDGSTPLKDLVEEDDDGESFELILDALGRGRLLLLPESVALPSGDGAAEELVKRLQSRR